MIKKKLSVLYPPEKRLWRKGGSMKKVIDFKPMDDAAKKQIAELAKLPESEINTSDLTEWTKADFAQAIPFQSLYKSRK